MSTLFKKDKGVTVFQEKSAADPEIDRLRKENETLRAALAKHALSDAPKPEPAPKK